jgi:hypothetical protein
MDRNDAFYNSMRGGGHGMATDKSTIEVAAEDKLRLTRLHEEVQGRLKEISMIIFRYAEKNQGHAEKPSNKGLTVVFNTDRSKDVQVERLMGRKPPHPHQHPDDDPGDECICLGEGSQCGCYNFTKGICHPCGAPDD